MFLFNCMLELVLNLYFMVVFPLSIIVLKDCLNKETRHALFLNLGKCAVPLPFFFCAFTQTKPNWRSFMFHCCFSAGTTTTCVRKSCISHIVLPYFGRKARAIEKKEVA